jgi:hypothetical protein
VEVVPVFYLSIGLIRSWSNCLVLVLLGFLAFNRLLHWESSIFDIFALNCLWFVVLYFLSFFTCLLQKFQTHFVPLLFAGNILIIFGPWNEVFVLLILFLLLFFFRLWLRLFLFLLFLLFIVLISLRLVFKRVFCPWVSLMHLLDPYCYFIGFFIIDLRFEIIANYLCVFFFFVV